MEEYPENICFNKRRPPKETVKLAGYGVLLCSKRVEFHDDNDDYHAGFGMHKCMVVSFSV